MNKVGECCFCGETYTNYGNDIRPLIHTLGNRCCDKCNSLVVIPNRMKFWFTRINDVYVIRNRNTCKFINKDGSDAEKNNTIEESIVKFNCYNEAEDYLVENCTTDYEVVKLIVREDN